MGQPVLFKQLAPRRGCAEPGAWGGLPHAPGLDV